MRLLIVALMTAIVAVTRTATFCAAFLQPVQTNHLCTFEQEHPPQHPHRTDTTSTTTRHDLFPFSVATTVDPRVYPWVAPNNYIHNNEATTNTRESNHYALSLQTGRVLAYQEDPYSSPREDLYLIPKGRSRPLRVYHTPQSSSTAEAALGKRPRRIHAHQQHKRPFRVYCDLDGVLVDFCHGIRSLFPHHDATQSVDALHRPTMWQKVDRANEFFANLPWMPDGQRLWHAIRPLQPDILTGVPYRVTKSSAQKFAWCQRELGVPVQHIDKAFGISFLSSSSSSSPTNHNPERVCRVITTWSQEKHVESGPGAVLIDDRIELKAEWEARGGIFVHHTGCVDTTLATLQKHGILPSTPSVRRDILSGEP